MTTVATKFGVAVAGCAIAAAASLTSVTPAVAAPTVPAPAAPAVLGPGGAPQWFFGSGSHDLLRVFRPSSDQWFFPNIFHFGCYGHKW
ncbi:hypothetical protein [Mycobacterium aquaticum]|uniref:Uncharacterized protein n=1 Tax=Mycobacterium aquaticum TaxID=1927124 RepID=A0A1X0AAD8_9MYCO|nr:hypothetical protein [Mycobacterium aquaticum]ORA26984.1 hypothetical protein BST13_31060 [Mycobacterium aquaticum]